MTSDESNEADSVVKWRSVYVAVVVFTAAVVAFLYVFSSSFAG